MNTQILVGMEYDRALNYCKEYQVRMRVVMMDNHPCTITEDYRSDRINVHAEHDSQGKLIVTHIAGIN